jgi:class 3 adenylate cyclase/CheY-like chemotaxis protein
VGPDLGETALNQPEGERKLAAILSADVAGYSRLMGEDDHATVATLNSYRGVFKDRVADHRGRVVDTAGDSVLAEFSSVVEAVACAVAVQGALKPLNDALPENRRMRFRIGINLGDVIVQDDGTIYGDGVNIAARMESLAEAGGVCLSGNVFDQVDGKLEFAFDFIGEHEVKNITKPVRVYRVRAAAEPGEAPAADDLSLPEKRARAVAGEDELAILIVDDNEDNRYTLSRRLKRQGHTNLAIAENGRQALDIMAEQPFGLVLLDIMMPEMNGYQVLEHIKSDMDLRDTSVIMISALDDMESVVRCLELGAEDYLPKPFNATLLKARVGAALEKKRLRDQQEAQMERLEAEKRRADNVLSALLPAGAARALKSRGEVRPARFDDVAVLVCEIVDFARRCEDDSPEQVESELRPLVDGLEASIDKHRLEQISAAGGMFTAAAGLYAPLDEAPLAAIKCGLDMVAAGRRLEPRWRVRVGIHGGAVFAGILGRKHYSFDLWGQPVDTARRLAREAEGGTVVVRGPLWMEVRGRRRGKSRGSIDLDGGETVEMIECHEAD